LSDGFASRPEPRRRFATALRAEAFDAKIARARIKAAPLEACDEAIETGEGPLAEALRRLAPEIDCPPRRTAA
jgi:hypothetical protein